MSSKTPAETKKEEKRPPTDFSKLETVTLSFNRPAKWYMYVVKQVLLSNKKVDIKARPSAAAQVVRVAEALKRLGYITYLKYQTTTQINDGKLQRFIIVSVQKTENFDKLYKEREEERAKKLAEQGKTPAEKK